MKKALCFIICIITLLSFAPVISASDYIRYGRTTLSANSNELYVYDLLVQNIAVSSPSSKIYFDEDIRITEAQVDKAVQLFVSDYPECFWFLGSYNYTYSSAGVVSVMPVYSFTGSGLALARVSFDSAVAQIISNVPSGTTYEKALYIHDAVANRVTYVQAGEHQSAYGALVDGKAVCMGYAKAYQLLMNMIGIPTWTVTGYGVDSESGEYVAHAWNLVFYNNDCVYTDVTWDDSEEVIFRGYFFLSLADISVNHIVDDEIFTLPSCNHKNHCFYATYPQYYFEELTVEGLSQCFGSVQNGERSTLFYLESGNVLDWISVNGAALCRSLGGSDISQLGYCIVYLGNEYWLKLTGFADSEEPLKEGWYEDSIGWTYYENGVLLKDKWIKDNGCWYYLDTNGYMATNKWVKDSKGWCYLLSNGKMAANKWIKDSKGWCYVGSDGYCVVNQWKKDSNGWCYLDKNGRMSVNKWIKDSKGWCFVGSNGYCVTNTWKKDSKGWCYLDNNGRMVISDWVKDSGKWYYLNSSGYMVTGTVKIDGKTEKFNSSGVWLG